MIDPLLASMRIAGSGLSANSTRLKVVSENIANANSTGTTPGSDPFQRKTITFDNVLDATNRRRSRQGRLCRRRHLARSSSNTTPAIRQPTRKAL